MSQDLRILKILGNTEFDEPLNSGPGSGRKTFREVSFAIELCRCPSALYIPGRFDYSMYFMSDGSIRVSDEPDSLIGISLAKILE